MRGIRYELQVVHKAQRYSPDFKHREVAAIADVDSQHGHATEGASLRHAVMRRNGLPNDVSQAETSGHVLQEEVPEVNEFNLACQDETAC